jgi:hypothetical protein
MTAVAEVAGTKRVTLWQSPDDDAGEGAVEHVAMGRAVECDSKRDPNPSVNFIYEDIKALRRWSIRSSRVPLGMTEFKEVCRVCYDEYTETPSHIVCKFCVPLLGSVRAKKVRRFRYGREPNPTNTKALQPEGRPALEIDHVATVVLQDK